MRIEHLAVWTYNLERLRQFYQHYFDATSTEIYYNHSKEYRSYFLLFEGECRLEIMEMPNIGKSKNDPMKNYIGLAHFALKVGNKTDVDRITDVIRADGYKVVSEPRSTGDGYYESVVLDPDGNKVELMA